jgi:hypothetical protein
VSTGTPIVRFAIGYTSMPDTQENLIAGIVAWVALALVAALSVLGLVWYGFSEDVRHRFWTDLIDRPGGPMTFRFVLQPAMAALAALHDGIKDARLGRSPYFWTIVYDPQRRTRRLREGLVSTARIILLGLVMDAIYQYMEFKTFYPGEAVIIALSLAVVPYFILRGPIARIARRRYSRAASQPK